MNFPPFPTDNLYKFLAIAGLVLTGYSASYGYNRYIELELQILRNATEEKILQIEQRQILDRVNRMKAKKEGELTEEEYEQTVLDTKDPLIKGSGLWRSSKKLPCCIDSFRILSISYT